MGLMKNRVGYLGVGAACRSETRIAFLKFYSIIQLSQIGGSPQCTAPSVMAAGAEGWGSKPIRPHPVSCHG